MHFPQEIKNGNRLEHLLKPTLFFQIYMADLNSITLLTFSAQISEHERYTEQTIKGEICLVGSERRVLL